MTNGIDGSDGTNQQESLESAVSQGMLAPITPVTDTALARTQAYNIGSLDNVVGGNQLVISDVDNLPNVLMQLTAVTTSSWAYVARTLKDIRDTDVWERIDDGKYAGDWDAFLKEYTKGQDYSAARASNLLGYINWLDENHKRILGAKPDDCSYESSQIPREKTMRFIMQYHEAFEESPELLASVFWYEDCDHDVLRAEILSKKGDTYVASREARDNRSKNLGGKMQRPTFGRYTPSVGEERNVMGDALKLLVGRARRLVCGQDAYSTLDTNQRLEVRQDMEALLQRVLYIDGNLGKSE